MGLVALEQRVRHENLVRPPHAGHRVGLALRREPLEERVAQLQHQPRRGRTECTPRAPSDHAGTPESARRRTATRRCRPRAARRPAARAAASKTAPAARRAPHRRACVPSNSCVCEPLETSTRASADGGHGRRRTSPSASALIRRHRAARRIHFNSFLEYELRPRCASRPRGFSKPPQPTAARWRADALRSAIFALPSTSGAPCRTRSRTAPPNAARPHPPHSPPPQRTRCHAVGESLLLEPWCAQPHPWSKGMTSSWLTLRRRWAAAGGGTRPSVTFSSGHATRQEPLDHVDQHRRASRGAGRSALREREGPEDPPPSRTCPQVRAGVGTLDLRGSAVRVSGSHP